MVETRDKPRLLAQFLREQGTGRTLVFTRTKHGADKVVRCLEKAGVRAAAIHGNKSQNARLRVLAEFKSERPPVLVATDIAARGLDIDQIAHVVNYDLPNVPETYVHRIGRTGRAGAKGSAISLCSGEEREFLKQIERLTRVRVAIREYTLPPADPATDPPTPRRPAASGNRPNNQGQRRGTGRRSHDDRANRDTSTGERDRVSNGRRASNGRVTASRDSASRGDMGRGDMGRGETGRGGQSRVGENRSRVGESRNDARRTDNSRTEARPADARQSRTGPSTSQPSREHTGGSRERSQATREAQPWPQKPVSVNRWSW
jgi:ATP-dependent RNA helicase RhlE